MSVVLQRTVLSTKAANQKLTLVGNYKNLRSFFPQATDYTTERIVTWIFCEDPMPFGQLQVYLP